MRSDNYYVTFCYRNDFIRIHKTSIAALGFPDYIRLLIDNSNRLFAIQPCDIRERDRIRVPKWTDIKSGSVQFHGMAFLERLTKLMGWSEDMTYRITGEVKEDTDGEPYLFFRLDEAREVNAASSEDYDNGRTSNALFSKGGSLENTPGIVFDLTELAIGINCTCLVSLDQPSHIQMLMNPDTEELIIRGVESTEKDAHRIPDVVYDGNAVYGIKGDPLVSMIYDLTGWDKERVYSMAGRKTPDGMRFSLRDAAETNGWERRIITEEYGLHE